MPKPPPKVSSGPWWLDAADAFCPHCLQAYAHGLHYHCSGCDGEVCAHCVIVLRTQVEVFCPTCDEGWKEKTS